MFSIFPSILRPKSALEVGLWADPVLGNDATGAGTRALPYLTLGKALTVASNGDTINLKSGMFVEAGISLAKNGITIRAGNGYAPVLSTASQYAPGAFSKTGGRTNIYQVAYAPGQTVYSCWHGETRLTLVADLATCDTTPNSYLSDPVTLHLIWVNVGGSAPVSTVYDTHTGQGVINSFTGASLVLDRLTFKWCDNAVIASLGSITLRNIVANHFGAYVLYMAGCSGAAVSNCMFLDGNTGAAGQSTDWISILTPSTGTYTLSNVVTDRSRHGVNVTAPITLNASDCSFTRCGPPDAGGLGDGIVSNAVAVSFNLLRCVFIDCAHGFVRVDTAGSTLTCKFCIGWLTGDVINNPGWGFIVDAGAVGALYHCTAAYLDRNISGGGGTGFLFQTNAGGNVIKNCIALHCKKGFDSGPNSPSWTEDYNANYAYSVAAGNMWGPAAHDVSADPLVVSSALNDFHLQTGSPCRAAGVALPGINDGATAYDLGRYVSGLN